MKFTPVTATVAAAIVLSCSSFIHKGDVAAIKKYEEPLYVMKAEKSVDQNVVAKGLQVKLLIVTGKENIKVYCYPADEDMLKARRTLLLYLFEDDFEKKVFDIKKFEQKLYEIVELKKQ